jgi:hypothetical protein
LELIHTSAHIQALKGCIRAIKMEMEKDAPRELAVREGAVFQEVSKQAAKFAAGVWKW